MSKPSRPTAAAPAYPTARTFFVTTSVAAGRSLFQTARMANLFIEVLRSYMRAGKFEVHDFVVMPNHVHILLTIPADSSVEQALQLIKGNFSYRVKKELGFQGEIWQRGFSDVRIDDEWAMKQHHEYIAQNPVKAGLAGAAEEYPFCFDFLKRQKDAGAKAHSMGASDGTRPRGCPESCPDSGYRCC